MSKRGLAALVAGAGLLLVPAAGALPAPAPDPASVRILVGYTAEGFAQAIEIEERAGAVRLGRIDPLRVDVLELPASEASAALGVLRASEGVRYAELDGRAHALRVPNDPFLSRQWSMTTTHARQAWDLTTGSPKVVVAVIDTGIDASQPDLHAKLVGGYDFVNDDPDPADDNGHGTAVAGVAAAGSDNRLGVASYCWQCVLMPVKVLDADGVGYDSDVAQGIVWATDRGARVLNLSLGDPILDATLAAAAQYAWAHGALVVAAAGNESVPSLNYPAAFPNVVSVSASDESDRLYSFSNSGALLAAPGENTTTGRGSSYVAFLGTSSAAPVVSGIAALAFAASPAATPGQVEQALLAGAVPVKGVTRGRVDAYGTLQALGLAPPGSAAPSEPSRGGGLPAGSGGGAGSKTTVIVGRLPSSRHARTIVLRPAAGILSATVVLRGSRAPVRLRLVRRGGSTVASARGKGRAHLRARVKRLTYRLAVRVKSRTAVSYRLTLSYPRRG
jgi:subtilisin family serine protease